MPKSQLCPVASRRQPHTVTISARPHEARGLRRTGAGKSPRTPAKDGRRVEAQPPIRSGDAREDRPSGKHPGAGTATPDRGFSRTAKSGPAVALESSGDATAGRSPALDYMTFRPGAAHGRANRGITIMKARMSEAAESIATRAIPGGTRANSRGQASLRRFRHNPGDLATSTVGIASVPNLTRSGGRISRSASTVGRLSTRRFTGQPNRRDVTPPASSGRVNQPGWSHCFNATFS
jgi:hypothetical protein